VLVDGAVVTPRSGSVLSLSSLWITVVVTTYAPPDVSCSSLWSLLLLLLLIEDAKEDEERWINARKSKAQEARLALLFWRFVVILVCSITAIVCSLLILSLSCLIWALMMCNCLSFTHTHKLSLPQLHMQCSEYKLLRYAFVIHSYNSCRHGTSSMVLYPLNEWRILKLCQAWLAKFRTAFITNPVNASELFRVIR